MQHEVVCVTNEKMTFADVYWVLAKTTLAVISSPPALSKKCALLFCAYRKWAEVKVFFLNAASSSAIIFLNSMQTDGQGSAEQHSITYGTLLVNVSLKRDTKAVHSSWLVSGC